MLEGPGGPGEDTKGMINIAVNYYKALFGFEEKISIDLAKDFWLEGEKVTSEQNLFLETEFTESEVKDAVFGSYVEGDPGPDGFFLFVLSAFLATD
jgi:hypothetical protein